MAPIGASSRLIANDVAHRYSRGRTSLTGVTLDLHGPGIVGLVGPNGAGKSTLIKLWAGLERPHKGSVAVGGLDPWRERAAASRLFAYVPQVPALYSALSVGDHLSLAVNEREAFDTRAAANYLDHFRVPLGVKAGHLSGGQRAQISLAVALATHAPVLLLDEPLASLDPLARREFLSVLAADTASSGATALLASHIVSDIEEVCTRLVVLGDGTVLLDSPIADLVGLFVTAPPLTTPWPGLVPIAEFIAHDRGRRVLLSCADDRRGSDFPRASLEEIVIGFLSAGQTPRENAS